MYKLKPPCHLSVCVCVHSVHYVCDHSCSEMESNDLREVQQMSNQYSTDLKIDYQRHNREANMCLTHVACHVLHRWVVGRQAQLNASNYNASLNTTYITVQQRWCEPVSPHTHTHTHTSTHTHTHQHTLFHTHTHTHIHTIFCLPGWTHSLFKQ